MTAGRQGSTAIENSDVIQTKKPTLEDVHAIGVFAIDPPGEIQKQLLKNALEKDSIAHSTSLLLDLVNAPRGPGVNRRIHIAKRPLISRQLTVRSEERRVGKECRSRW